MDMLVRASVFLWISAVFLPLLLRSEACPSNDSPALCEYVFKNVCFEFVEESRTWSESRSDCEKLGGNLLKVMKSPIKTFLKNIAREKNFSDLTFWLGEGVLGEPSRDNGNVSEYRCTYMMLNPLQLMITPDCNKRRSFLCTHNLYSPSNKVNTIVSGHASRHRLKRNVQEMGEHLDDISQLLQIADRELQRMEQTPGEPTNENRDTFIQILLQGTKNLEPKFAVTNNETISHIINCSTAILLLSHKRCDISINPNPTSLFEQIFEIFQTVSLLLGQTASGFVIKHRTGTIYQESYNQPADLDNAVLGSESDGFVKLPSFSVMESQFDITGGTVVTQLSTFSDNPHPTDEITGTVCKILISQGQEEVKLTNLTQMIEIFLPRPEALAIIDATVQLDRSKKVVSTLNVTDPYTTVVFNVDYSANETLILTLSNGSPPNSTNSNHSYIMRPQGSSRWLITPEMLQQTTGTWYVDTRLINSTKDEGLTLNISYFMTKCLYWHVELDVWTTDGCQVGEKSMPSLTHCLCNHLTLFGSSFFVMPNYVDVSRTSELFATVNDNYVVLALLCAFFGLYLITLLWACYAERRAQSRRKMTLLEGNHPGAMYNYLICVQTGHRKNAGTSANVTVMLTGAEGESETYTLTDPDKPLFERAAVDLFVLATPFPLGEVRQLRLQHDNAGGHPSWYINKVTVQDLQTRQVWHYFCDCWLSADRGDGLTKKTVNAAKNNEITSFRNIFQSRTSTGFRDEHIWVSIVDPPSRSPFTRAQRVSCCMSLLLCTMAINIAFWNLPVDADSPVLFSFGSMQITWQEIMVGIQSGLLMFPINILIITIFRSIRPRIRPKKDNSENLRPTTVTIPTILKDTEEVISLLSKNPRNKMSVMPRLECTSDISPALDSVHEFIQLMQGENDSDPHWVHCSRFLLAGLCHLLMCLEKVDVKNFQSPEEYQQVLNITNLLVRKAEMVFTSHLAYCPPPVKKRRKTGGWWLPWWCVFLGWFLLLSISVVSTYFTLLYGFSYGREKSIKWVISLGLSLFQSIFILQPLKVIGIAVFFALMLKPVAVEESEEVEQVLTKQHERCRFYTGKDTL